MSKTTDVVSHYGDQFRLLSGEPGLQPWLAELRMRAMKRFTEIGFPSTRDEEWRFTNVEPIAEGGFALPPPTGKGVAESDIARLAGGGVEQGPRIVFTDGAWSASLSRLSGLPDGIRVEPFSTALAGSPDLIRRHVGRYAKFDTAGFTALSTAFLREGALVHVGAGVEWDHPIQIVFAASGVEGIAIHPRCLIVVEQGAKAVVQELYVGPGGKYFTNAVTELVVADGARLDHYRIQNDSPTAYHIASTHSQQGRDSVLESCSVAFGSRMSRHEVEAVLGGSGAFLTLNGLSVLGGHQHVDHHTVIDHAQPHCESHELFNGVFDEQARGIFNGRIVVRPGAQRTDSKQTNNNLLVSKDARADSQPQLEIYADDVKCTHGATLGPLDDTSMFYLQSRGIDAAQARKLLTYGFGADIVNRAQSLPVRKYLDRLLGDRLGHLPLGGVLS